MTCLDRDRQRVIISALFDSGGPIPRSELRRLLLRGRTTHVGAEAAGQILPAWAGLLAIVTGVSAFTLGKTVQALQPPFGLLIAIGVVAAFTIAIAATIAALRASGGLPTLSSTPAVGAARQDAVTAATDLRRAIRRSLLALIIFGVVAATSWFAPRTADSPALAIIEADGRTLCGKLDAKTVPGTLLITPPAKSVEIVELASVRPWKNVKQISFELTLNSQQPIRRRGAHSAPSLQSTTTTISAPPRRIAQTGYTCTTITRPSQRPHRRPDLPCCSSTRTCSSNAVSASKTGSSTAASNATTNSNSATASTKRPAPRYTIAMLNRVVASPARSPTSRRMGNACSK
jgi:hypothetical protein